MLLSILQAESTGGLPLNLDFLTNLLAGSTDPNAVLPLNLHLSAAEPPLMPYAQGAIGNQGG
ncbi:MAG: hypothetical protein EPN72_04645 [Nevskiaceae bacterium]|nr:MAG: hypothetical protein EPN63_07425 [Nevskiaceae bacterium]TBR74089.1 MAG: hypothetical protein EPN72_04645 [Nevskiaceae bacterium]